MNEIIEDIFLEQQVKSKERVSDFGEVFTNRREVNAMLDLVKDESYRVDSRFLEPACGTGNFLVEILNRKLKTVNEVNYVDQIEWEKQAFIAISSIYAIDIQADNCEESRERMYKIVETAYKEVYPDNQDNKFLKAIKYILDTNIVLGNGLSGFQVDPVNEDDKGMPVELLDKPIVFTEFNFERYYVIRKDFTMNGILKYNKDIEEKNNKKIETAINKTGIESDGLFATGALMSADDKYKLDTKQEEIKELEPVSSTEPIYFKDIHKD